MPRDTFANIATLTNITEADLASNRIGQLSDTQKASLESRQRRGKALGIVFGVILAGFGLYLLIGQAEVDIQLNGIFSLLLSVAAFYFTFRPSTVSAEDIQVQQVTGHLQKEAIDNEGVSHFLIIEDVRLQVSQSFYETFSEGDPYTFFILCAKRKMSLKHLDCFLMSLQ
ncbi:MAG: hypothetical protein AAFR81_28605 [Chloroflexota bacterium]